MNIKLLDHTEVDKQETINKMFDDTFYYKELNLDKCLSYSTLKWLLKSPKWFEYMKRKGMTPTQALRDGRLVHTEILEPNKYMEFTFVDVSSKNTKKYQLAKQKYGAENTFTFKEKYMNNRIATAFLQNDACTNFLKGSETEVGMLTELNGLPFRAKADIYNAEAGFVADVKTTNDGLKDIELKDGSLKNQFGFTIDKYDYDLQAYIYCMMYDVPDFYWLVIDKTTTDIGIFKASDETLHKGELKFNAATELYKAFFIDELIDLSQYHKEGEL